MSKLFSPSRIEVKVNEQMEKFLLRSNTSHRQLVSKISSKLVKDELIFIEKFKRPRKLVIPEFKVSMMLNEEKPQVQKSPDEIKGTKFKRSSKISQTNSAKLSPRYTLPGTPMFIENQSPSERILNKYGLLFASTSESPKLKKIHNRKEKKKVKTLCKKIHEIGKSELTRKQEEEVNTKIFDKYHEKKYLKEAIKEMKTKKFNDSVNEAKLYRFSIQSAKSAR